MCGRYAASADPDELVEAFEVELDATGRPSRSLLSSPQQPPPGHPDYNMAPTKLAPVVLTRAPARDSEAAAQAADTGEELAPVRQLRLLTWGLVPSWAKDVRVGARMINARAESLLDKPAFRRAAATRRALVPAQGWYEWQASPVALDVKGKPRKQPFFISRADGQGLAFAGLYEFWRDPATPADDPYGWVTSFTIVTTSAEPGLDRIHDRQPLVLDRDRWADWLDPSTTALDDVRELMAAPGPGRFRAWPVGRAVNTTGNNDQSLVEPLPTDQLHGVVDPTTGEVIG